jgi:hypothetical protein
VIRGAEVIEERDEEEEVIEVGEEEVIEVREVVERGAGQVWEMQRRIDALQEIMESYERSSKRMLRMLVRADEREEALRKIRTMVNRCGCANLRRECAVTHIYDTAWTINGEQVMGRTSGWRWYELGAEDASHQAHYQSVVVTQAYAEGLNTPFQWESITYAYDGNYGVTMVHSPQRGQTTTYKQEESYVPVPTRGKRGEAAILSFYTDDYSGYSYPYWYTGSGGTTEAFRVATYNSIQGQECKARLQLPIATALRVTIDGPGDGYTLGLPRGLRWRAIVGEYTAPGA